MLTRARYAVYLLVAGTIYVSALQILRAEEAGAITGEPWACHTIDSGSRGADGVRLADVNGDGRMDIATGWEEGGVTRLYLHPGPQKVRKPWPAVTVGRTPSVEDAVITDLDGDGAFEVISCCEGRTKSIFIHQQSGDTPDLLAAQTWRTAALPASRDKMQWMYAVAMQVDGEQGVDLLAAGKNVAAKLGWFQAPPNPGQWDQWKWHAICPVGWVMSIIPIDMDGDGDTDPLITDRRGKLRGCRWLENPGPGEAQRKPWASHAVGDTAGEVMFCKIGDVDGDGLEDVIVPIINKGLKLCRRLDRGGKRWQTLSIPLPDEIGRLKAAAVGDFNGDGRADLALTSGMAGGKHGVYWLEQPAGGLDRPWPAHAISGRQRGIKFDRIELIDLDADGDLDLLTCEEREGGGGMGVIWYENPLK